MRVLGYFAVVCAAVFLLTAVCGQEVDVVDIELSGEEYPTIFFTGSDGEAVEGASCFGSVYTPLTGGSIGMSNVTMIDDGNGFYHLPFNGASIAAAGSPYYRFALEVSCFDVSAGNGYGRVYFTAIVSGSDSEDGGGASGLYDIFTGAESESGYAQEPSGWWTMLLFYFSLVYKLLSMLAALVVVLVVGAPVAFGVFIILGETALIVWSFTREGSGVEKFSHFIQGNIGIAKTLFALARGLFDVAITFITAVFDIIMGFLDRVPLLGWLHGG